MTLMQGVANTGKDIDYKSDFAALQDYVRAAATTGTAVHEVELGLWKRLLALGRQLLGQFFAQVGNGDQGENLTLPDGRRGQRLAAPHCRPYQSIFGDFELERIVYGSREGQRIEYVPFDAQVHLPQGKFSYVLQDWEQRRVVEQPYQPVAQWVERLFGIDPSVASLEQMTRTLADDVELFWAAAAPPPPASAKQVVVMSGDGKGVPMRKPADAPPIAAHAHQPGPKPDRKKMATVGAVYQVDPSPRTPEAVVAALFHDPATPVADPTPTRPSPEGKRVRAYLNVASAPAATSVPTATDRIMTWLAEEARQRDPTQQCPWVVLMDGQTARWDAAARALGDTPRIEILDLLHVNSYLWEAVHLFQPPGSPLAESFMKFSVLAILHGQVEAWGGWMQDNAERAGLSRAQQAELQRILNYFAHHRARMQYDVYFARGYPIASGVIEGACRHVVKDRLERTGMHWTDTGAQAVLRLRCVVINDEWERFLQYRVAQEIARLYPFRPAVESPVDTLPWAA
jgi:hypothetical protein